MINLDDTHSREIEPSILKYWIEGKIKDCHQPKIQKIIIRRTKPNIKHNKRKRKKYEK